MWRSVPTLSAPYQIVRNTDHATEEAAAHRLGDQMARQYDRAVARRTLRNVIIGAAAVVYGYAVIDGWSMPPEGYLQRVSFDVAPAWDASSVGLSLRVDL